ncbi:MAG: hypothetical protein ACT4UP_09205 [Gammaproteobacteria bacterium]
MLRMIVSCAMAVLASGCVTQPVYHESWAAQVKLAEDDGCPDVDGIFGNAGDGYERKSRDRLEHHDLSLAHLLNGGFGMERHHAPDRFGDTSYAASADSYQAVNLRREGEFLLVEGFQGGQVVRSFRMPVRLPCRDSLLVVESAISYDLFMAAFARGYYALGRADDGSLLAYGSIGGVMLGAIWGSTAFWARFAESAPGPAAVADTGVEAAP